MENNRQYNENNKLEIMINAEWNKKRLDNNNSEW